MTDGISAVLSRISEITSLLQGAPVTRTTVAAGSSSSSSGSSSSSTTAGTAATPSFDSVLAGVTGSGGAADLPSVLPTSVLPTSGAPVTSPAAAATSPTGAAVVSDASRYLGVPYVWGGTNPATGLDCSGLVQRTYADLGITLPRTSTEQARQGTPVASLAQAQPGDLVAFGSPVDHIGIYAGNGTMVVAPHTGTRVQVQQITGTPTAIRRIVGSPTAATSGRSTAYDALFAQAQAKYGVPASLLSAVARVESDDDPTAVSGAGARGLMQLMPGTAQGLGVDPMDPAQAVDGAARLLKSHLAQFGSTELALAAYNAGEGAVRKYGGIPPYAETQAYVKRVMAYAAGGSA